MFSDVLYDICHGAEPTVDSVTELLSTNDPKELEQLYEAARSKREEHFGNTVYTYGFVYFSTHCKNNCTFCYYRRSNKDLERYRKSKEEIVQLAGSLKDAGIDLADLTMGEDPEMYANGYEKLLDIIHAVKHDVGISVMASPGALPSDMFPAVKEAGADWYACYQETYNRELFAKLRIEQDFEKRLDQKISSRKAGLLAEDGMMVGLGESVRDRAEAILKMGGLGCEQIRTMTFVPQEGTPLMMSGTCDTVEELKCIAVMRILFPDRLIPATLDVEGIAGMQTRLAAGANVVTSIVPPHLNLAGVAQHELDIENGNRSVEHVFEMVESMGYRLGTAADYRRFIQDTLERRSLS